MLLRKLNCLIFTTLVGLDFNNIATNDAMVKAKLNEMSSQGWELAFVTSGVESADKERDAIFITRYHFQKRKITLKLNLLLTIIVLYFAFPIITIS